MNRQKVNSHGEYTGFLDYLTDELWTSFKMGAQVWESEKNHKAQRQMVMNALARAKVRYRLAQDDGKELVGGEDDAGKT